MRLTFLGCREPLRSGPEIKNPKLESTSDQMRTEFRGSDVNSEFTPRVDEKDPDVKKLAFGSANVLS